MNWEAIGAIGEIVGAIGVILTLLYLANQLRQNTKAMESTTTQAYNSGSQSTVDSFILISDVLAKQQEGKELTIEEQIRLGLVYIKVFTNMETTFLQHKSGSLNDEVFETRMRGFKKSLLELQGMLNSWKDYRGYDLSDSFYDFVEGMLEEDA